MIKNESFIEEKVIDNIYPQRISFYKTKYSLNHRSIGLLRFIDQNNTQYLGTAFLISSNLILTAAHNVYDK